MRYSHLPSSVSGPELSILNCLKSNDPYSIVTSLRRVASGSLDTPLMMPPTGVWP